MSGLDGVERVHVYYPRGDRTGGPEALHQLVHAIRACDVDASLVPMRGTAERPRVAQYEHYDAPEVPAVSDDPGVAVVFPEVYLEPVRALQRARPVCWWLSVDGSALWSARTERDNRRRLGRRTDPVLALRLVKQRAVRAFWLPRLRDPRVLHLAQSEYARLFLTERMDLAAHRVSDYLPELPESPPRAAADDADDAARPNVAYNPAKGSALVDAVRGVLGDRVGWTPIRGLDAAGVRAALEQAHVYLDLGHQPGKDRLPREAALAGAVTLVARVGAGANDVDVPVPAEHKISYSPDVARVAADTVLRVLGDLERSREMQAPYRDSIRDEKRRFHHEVRTVFAGPPVTSAAPGS